MAELEGELPVPSTVVGVTVIAHDDPGEFRTVLNAVVPAASLRWVEAWPPDDERLMGADILFAPLGVLDTAAVADLKARYPRLRLIAVVRKRMGDDLLARLNGGLDGFVRPALGRHPVGQQVRVLLRSVEPKAPAS